MIALKMGLGRTQNPRNEPNSQSVGLEYLDHADDSDEQKRSSARRGSPARLFQPQMTGEAP
jgi:hypothetical protein